MDALTRGASDYVTKPSNVGKVTNSQATVKNELIRKIKALTGRQQAGSVSSTASLQKPKVNSNVNLVKNSGGSGPFDIVVIGVSTGGPNALAKVIPSLPKDFSAPILIVQHMPPMFTKLLAERLNAQSPLCICEAEAGMEIKAGHVYIAPGDFHLRVSGTRSKPMTALDQEQQENSCRPAVDPLFRSAAALYGPNVLAVVLTGMGQDGLEGCQHIRERGGTILVQDKASSVVWGMPGAVADGGLANQILPLEAIAQEICRKTLPAGKKSASLPARSV